jgi:hypothetical protein
MHTTFILNASFYTSKNSNVLSDHTFIFEPNKLKVNINIPKWMLKLWDFTIYLREL